MIWRIRIGQWRFTFTMARTVNVVGVNSILPDGKHILMWDFDDVELPQVCMELEHTQAVYYLPNIYIFNTGKPNHYIAYCFKKVDWRKAIQIITYTGLVDLAHIKYGIFRGHFTLRVTPKGKRKPRLAWILKSEAKEDVYLQDLRSWVRYETLADGQEVKVREVRIG